MPQKATLYWQEVRQALGLPKLAELCCHKQGSCKSPGGIRASETMAFSIFLITKHIPEGNNIETEIFKVKPGFHKSVGYLTQTLKKTHSLFMRNK